MKKIILGIVFVFASFTMVNANSDLANESSCTEDAWDFGTGWDNGDPESEWYWTNAYFEEYCNDDGTYKDEVPGYYQ